MEITRTPAEREKLMNWYKSEIKRFESMFERVDDCGKCQLKTGIIDYTNALLELEREKICLDLESISMNEIYKFIEKL